MRYANGMRIRMLLVVLLALASLLACRSQPSSAAANPERLGSGRDLAIDESRGGHTLARHVARTDEQLRERLQRERNISAASSYVDRPTAERVVGAAIQQNRAKIERWMERGERRPNLVLDYDEPAEPIGRVMNRSALGSVPCDHAIVILKADGPRDYYVLTSYPECRP
jgi:hypothetical protein